MQRLHITSEMRSYLRYVGCCFENLGFNVNQSYKHAFYACCEFIKKYRQLA